MTNSFNLLCKLAETHMPELLSMLKSARLFIIDKPRPFDQIEELSFDGYESIFLPYDTVAIVSDNVVCIIKDTVPDQIGCRQSREFIEATKVEASEFDQKTEDYFNEITNIKETMHITHGSFYKGEGSNDFKGYIHSYITANKQKILFNPLKDIKDESEQIKCDESYTKPAENIIALLFYFFGINEPSTFILEDCPLHVKVNGKKVPRVHQRPNYTILKPTEIRRRMQLDEPIVRSKPGERRLHECRKHMAFLSHEKYRYDNETGLPLEPKKIPHGPRKGQLYYKTAYVRAHWRGETEKRIGNHVYRVIYDR